MVYRLRLIYIVFVVEAGGVCLICFGLLVAAEWRLLRFSVLVFGLFLVCSCLVRWGVVCWVGLVCFFVRLFAW